MQKQNTETASRNAQSTIILDSLIKSIAILGALD